MNLVFEKNDPQTINVKINDDGNIQDFDYMAMIKGILSTGSLDVSELKGDFSDVEKSSIESMIRHLNECVPQKEEAGGLANEQTELGDDPLAE
jgi:hypothetical protein